LINILLNNNIYTIHHIQHPMRWKEKMRIYWYVAYTNIHMCVFIHTYVQVHTNIYICIHTNLDININIYMYICIQVYIYYRQIYRKMYIHKYTFTFKHLYRNIYVYLQMSVTAEQIILLYINHFKKYNI